MNIFNIFNFFLKKKIEKKFENKNTRIKFRPSRPCVYNYRGRKVKV